MLSMRFNRDFDIAEGCISNISSGYYDLYVYDIENDNTLSQLPAIIKNQVFVDERTTTTLIITSLSILDKPITALTIFITTTISTNMLASSLILSSSIPSIS